jgi:hypothetical protein
METSFAAQAIAVFVSFEQLLLLFSLQLPQLPALL